jgi:RNA polymerase sigma-70 factor (ECF subfamily)
MVDTRADVEASLHGVSGAAEVPIEVDRHREDPARVEASSSNRLTSLVERAVQNDREAFGELYGLFHAKVFRLARFHLNGSAEDAVAETFLRAWVALPRYRNTGAPFSAWLYGIARHVVADERKALRRVEPRSELPDRPTEPQEDDRLMLAMAIQRLPRLDRRLIELKFLMGLTNAEVAAALGKSVGAINAQQWRALRKLRASIGEI